MSWAFVFLELQGIFFGALRGSKIEPHSQLNLRWLFSQFWQKYSQWPAWKLCILCPLFTENINKPQKDEQYKAFFSVVFLKTLICAIFFISSTNTQVNIGKPLYHLWSVRVAERLALPTLDHRVPGSNPAGGEILPEPKRHFIAQSLSCSPFHCLEMTEILLKGCKTLTHPSIHTICARFNWRQIIWMADEQCHNGG